jgi:hypothetical protein
MGIDAGFTALIISCLTFVSVSYLTSPQQISDKLRTAMEA